MIDVLVKAGQEIDKETPMITLETEKAAMDVPAPAAGRIAEVKVKKGDKVSEGSVILLLESDGAGCPGKPAAQSEPTAAAGAAAPGAGAATSETAKSEAAPAVAAKSDSSVDRPADDAATSKSSAPPRAAEEAKPVSPAPSPRAEAPRGTPPIDEKAFSTAYASPSVRKFARELGADLGKIKGTGPKGRITHEDVKAYVKKLLSARAGRRGRLCPRYPKSTSRSSAPSRSSRCRASS